MMTNVAIKNLSKRIAALKKVEVLLKEWEKLDASMDKAFRKETAAGDAAGDKLSTKADKLDEKAAKLYRATVVAMVGDL